MAADDRSETFQAAGLPGGFVAHMAQRHAQRTHLMETTGIDVPAPGDIKAGAGQAAYMTASDLLLSGDFVGAQEALGRAVTDASASGNYPAASRLQALRDQVQNAEPKPSLPPLARTGHLSRDTIAAVDHNGTEHVVRVRGGEVTVRTAAGTAQAPAGDDPTATARELAGQLADRAAEHEELAGLAAAAVPDIEPEA